MRDSRVTHPSVCIREKPVDLDTRLNACAVDGQPDEVCDSPLRVDAGGGRCVHSKGLWFYGARCGHVPVRVEKLVGNALSSLEVLGVVDLGNKRCLESLLVLLFLNWLRTHIDDDDDYYYYCDPRMGGQWR